MSDKLKCCSFCGGTDLEIRYLDEDYGECVVDSEEELDENLHPWILCSNCLNETFYRELDTPRDIIKAWNTRKPMEKIKEDIMDLYTYYDNDYFSSKGNTLVDRNEVIEIVEKGGME